GQGMYGTPTDCTTVLRLMDLTNFQKLEKIGDRQFSSRKDDTTSDKWGKPMQYNRYRDGVDLQPVPDAVYTIEMLYRYDVPDMVADTDVPGIPSTWHIGLVYYGKYLYYDSKDDIPKKNDSYQAWKLWVADKPTEIDEESKADIDSGVEILS